MRLYFLTLLNAFFKSGGENFSAKNAKLSTKLVSTKLVSTGAVLLEKNYPKNRNKYKLALFAAVFACFCVVAATYKSGQRAVTRFFNSDRIKLDKGGAELAAIVSEYYAAQPEFAEYAAFVDAPIIAGILKNSQLNIISVERPESETVVAVIEITSDNIDAALDVYFDATIESAVSSAYAAQSKPRAGLLSENIGLALSNQDTSQTRELSFEFVKSNTWIPKNPEEFYAEYYGALTNEIFLKISNFYEDKASERFLKAFLESLKTESAKIFSSENSNVLEIISLFYSNTSFEILNSQNRQSRDGGFEVVFYVCDAAVFFKYVEDRAVEFFKTRNDAKQTPSGAEMNQKYAELIIESFEANKENRVAKQVTARVSQSFEILNLREIFGELLLDFYAERNNCAGNIERRIENLYKN